MGVVTSETEISSPVPASRLFKAFVLEAVTLLPKIVPQAIKSIQSVEGDGSPGTIEKVLFAEGLPFTYSKNIVEFLDKDNFTFRYSMIEGDVLPEKIEKITNELKFLPNSDGGSVFKTTALYYPAEGFEITEEEINTGKDDGLGIFKAVEAYLLENPNACN